jgi:hypothetical protein
MPRKKSPTQFVICVRNDAYRASLELRKVYQNLDDPEAARHKMLRIIDESGEDYLYPSDYFVAVKLPRGALAVFSPVL